MSGRHDQDRLDRDGPAAVEHRLSVDIRAPGQPALDGHTALLLSGPLTAPTAQAARDAIGTALLNGPWLTLTVEDITRLDRVGLAVLVAAAHRVRRIADDGCLHLVGGSRSATSRALASTGLWRVLPVGATEPPPHAPRPTS